MKPRQYQLEAEAAIIARYDAGDRRTLCVLPTGGGKTVVAAHVAKRFLPKGRVLVLVHRDELLRQAVDKFTKIAGVMPAVEKAEEFSDEDSMHGKSQVVVASIQTLNSGADDRRRMCKFDPKEFSFVWVDEAHHAVAETFRRTIDYFTSGNPDAVILFTTATADRADGEALGQVIESVAFDYELPDIIRDGYLVPIRARSVRIEGLDFSKCRTTAGDLNQADLEAAMLVEKPLHGIAHATIEVACGLEQGLLETLKDREDRVEALAAAVGDKPKRKTLIFTVTVKHAQLMAEILNRWLPRSAASIDGGMPIERRREILRDYARGKILFLCNCMIATEGFDEPSIELVVVARPTKSRPLFSQMVGRGTRPAAELAPLLGDLPNNASRRDAIAASAKPSMTILDFVGVTGKHKLVCTADLLGGERFDEAVVERAKELAAEGEVNVEDALAEAEAEAELGRAVERMAAEEWSRQQDEEEERRAAEAARRAMLVGTAQYRVKEVDPFNGCDVTPERDTGMRRGGASDAQVNLLVKLGVRRETALAYTKRQAGAVIESVAAKRCTDGQRGLLRRAGYTESEVEAFNMKQASAEIDRLKANGWRRLEAVA